MNKEKIISVIENHAVLGSALVCDWTYIPKFCFIGALLHSAGYSIKRLKQLRGSLNPVHGTYNYTRKILEKLPTSRTKEYWARKKLRETYGLTDAEIREAIKQNDRAWEEYRKSHMIKWVNSQ
jgi:hypothetical protein